jgi:hypothetical protein
MSVCCIAQHKGSRQSNWVEVRVVEKRTGGDMGVIWRRSTKAFSVGEVRAQARAWARANGYTVGTRAEVLASN